MLECHECDWQNYWGARFKDLLDFKAEHVHCFVASRHVTSDGAWLGYWLDKQRSAYRDGKLGADRVRRLGAEGFCWEGRGNPWEARFTDLLEFKAEHGHCLCPVACEHKGREAG